MAQFILASHPIINNINLHLQHGSRSRTKDQSILYDSIPWPIINEDFYVKVSGSYYADVEASCQLFHVCVQVSEYEVKLFVEA